MLQFKSFACASLILLIAQAASVSGAPSVTVTKTPGEGAVPDAETAKDGSIHVAYVSGEDVFYVVSTNAGKTFSAPLRVNSEPGTAHPANMFRGPDLAIGQNGRVHVIWYVNAYQRKLPPDQWGVFYAHLDPTRGGFSKAVNLNHKPSDNYSLAADEKGNVAAVWMAGAVFVNTSKNNGETFSDAERIDVADPCECCASRASFSPTGALMIDYRDKTANIRDMHLLVRAPGSATFAKEKISVTPWQVTGCPMTGTFLANAGKEEIAAWETKGQISYARIDPVTGKRKTNEIKVADQGKWPIALPGRDGSVLVSWKESSALKWQLFDAADQPSGNPGGNPSPNSTRHAGTTTRAGDFVLID
ncbi:MAG TPA: hypothetical protein VI282_05055 [Verrucomicrobiae bacterium]